MQSADVSKEKADLMHAIYERITVAGPEIVGVRLTAAAYAHGLALALPEKVEMARPTGVERPDARNIRIPIEESTLASWPKAPDRRQARIGVERLPERRFYPDPNRGIRQRLPGRGRLTELGASQLATRRPAGR